MLVQWNKEYSVHVYELDTQHRKLVGMINELFTAVRCGRGRGAVGRSILGLLRCAQTHFATEEKYFDQFQYAEAERHKAEHADFVSRISKFEEELKKARADISIDLLNYLSDWLGHHIKISDKRYGPVFNAHGLN